LTLWGPCQLDGSIANHAEAKGLDKLLLNNALNLRTTICRRLAVGTQQLSGRLFNGYYGADMRKQD
jgi:hypothetical protein